MGSGVDFPETCCYPVDAATAGESVSRVALLAGAYPLTLSSVIAGGKWAAAAVVLVKLPRGRGGAQSDQDICQLLFIFVKQFCAEIYILRDTCLACAKCWAQSLATHTCACVNTPTHTTHIFHLTLQLRSVFTGFPELAL